MLVFVHDPISVGEVSQRKSYVYYGFLTVYNAVEWLTFILGFRNKTNEKLNLSFRGPHTPYFSVHLNAF